MRPVSPRPASFEEASVVRNALRRAPRGAELTLSEEAFSSLRVVGACDCGCASIYFAQEQADDAPVADGMGVTPSGKEVGVMVWARDGMVTALDIVDHHYT